MTKTLIAIVGASASGKSLFAQTIFDELTKEIPANQLGILQEDAYYRDQSHLPMSERVKTNYDHPNAFEHELLLTHLNELRAGNTVESPVYDYSEHTRSQAVRTINPAEVMMVEGILLLTDPKLRDAFDIKLFIDTPLDICLLRRIKRDTQERGRTIDSVAEQYENTVRPMFYQFIEPCKHKADVVVTRGGKNRIAIEMVKQKIRGLLADGTDATRHP